MMSGEGSRVGSGRVGEGIIDVVKSKIISAQEVPLPSSEGKNETAQS